MTDMEIDEPNDAVNMLEEEKAKETGMVAENKKIHEAGARVACRATWDNLYR